MLDCYLLSWVINANWVGVGCAHVLIPRSYLFDFDDIWLPLYMVLVCLHLPIAGLSLQQVWCDWFSQLFRRLFNLHLLYLYLRLFLLAVRILRNFRALTIIQIEAAIAIKVQVKVVQIWRHDGLSVLFVTLLNDH